jgi:phosphatidylserine/phosphatidylglycerophosphate/cardiolipin synthase-like enzyme
MYVRLSLMLCGVTLGCVGPPAGSGSGGADVSEPTVRAFFMEPGADTEDATAVEALVTLVDQTRDRLDIAAYELDLQPFVDAVAAAHDRGVAVRVVGEGDAQDDPGFAQLDGVGVPIAYRTAGAGIMHDKFIVSDADVVWTGSANFTENGFYLNNNDVLILPSAVLAERYLGEFEQMYAGDFGRNKAVVPLTSSTGAHEMLFAPEEDTLGRIVTAINEATTSVHFLVFSFTREDVADALRAASLRGVEVVGVVDASQAGSSWSQDDWLAQHGVPVYLDGNHENIGFAGGKLHHKLLLVDGETEAPLLLTGSSNWSNRAADDNDENVLILREPAVVQQYEDSFWARVDEAELHPEFRSSSLAF